MYLLDTNHCSFIIERDSNVVQKLLEVKEQNIFTCDIVEGELLFMAYNSRYKRENLKKVEAFCQLSVFIIQTKKQQKPMPS
jgi:tRNA(fMet)-specific endonuclease VapC